tara:strand:- start:842 stop:1015 length:174 start_codon:yes stop_codon:yes gene_type:complete
MTQKTKYREKLLERFPVKEHKDIVGRLYDKGVPYKELKISSMEYLKNKYGGRLNESE